MLSYFALEYGKQDDNGRKEKQTNVSILRWIYVNPELNINKAFK